MWAIDFCMEKGCKLIQVSTTSVAGISIENDPPEDTVMDETMLYFGQNLDNKYIDSKFRAERLVLEAAAKGLNAKIMRVGNLMGRSVDGEFQINFNTHGFINRLRAYQAIGKITFSAMGAETEFAPIDSTAQAILRLARAPRECCVFHPYNNHSVYIADVIAVMRERGIRIDEAEECEYQEAFSAAMHDKSKTEALSGLIAYLNMGKGKRIFMLHTSNTFTIQALYRTGFKWPLTTDGYLDKFISLLEGLGFFEEDWTHV
jgi:thioester reductase-like protein